MYRISKGMNKEASMIENRWKIYASRVYGCSWGRRDMFGSESWLIGCLHSANSRSSVDIVK
jgi:hypothetical protein